MCVMFLILANELGNKTILAETDTFEALVIAAKHFELGLTVAYDLEIESTNVFIEQRIYKTTFLNAYKMAYYEMYYSRELPDFCSYSVIEVIL